VLCGYSALRDALVLQADAFSGRGAMAVFQHFTRGNGILFSNGPRWWTLRNFALGALKEFGLGTRTIEERILEEAACLLELRTSKSWRMQAELDAVVGRTRTPRLEDREHLPYTNAVLHEIQRFISVLPLGLPRALTKDTHLRGYFLPKGTFVIPVLKSSHRDPTQFKDPECFNPTNFLDDKGKFQRAWFPPCIPVSSGKRMCLGAGLARSEIFLFFTAILQRFCLLPVGSRTDINLTPQCTGLGNIPPAFQLRLVAR
uniref:Uncharacterized protein n=1 Tax=Neovison vison TaxID=452646 RepID=A0A8C7B5H1_NEOVI